ncbi:MAG: YqhA family protein [Actinomycetota bacterium]|nr:YqhA family protein [Actinomycetota bacterium]
MAQGSGTSRLVGWTRFVIGVPVIATFVGSLTIVAVGAIETVRTVIDVVGGKMTEKQILLAFIELTDLFLLSTVLYIVALGLYSLFIDDNVPLPAWLEIHTLEDLKEKLVGVVIVVLAVLFLGEAIKSKDALSLLYKGAGMGVVILALSYFLGAIGHGGAKAGARAREGER